MDTKTNKYVYEYVWEFVDDSMSNGALLYCDYKTLEKVAKYIQMEHEEYDSIMEELRNEQN